MIDNSSFNWVKVITFRVWNQFHNFNPQKKHQIIWSFGTEFILNQDAEKSVSSMKLSKSVRNKSSTNTSTGLVGDNQQQHPRANVEPGLKKRQEGENLNKESHTFVYKTKKP